MVDIPNRQEIGPRTEALHKNNNKIRGCVQMKPSKCS